ncbi:MAG: hypothetical protein H7X97_08775, partial [Opitutaceae bacterium]|nr:hypothetical protein [Verrucomicrobiales bacterium]
TLIICDVEGAEIDLLQPDQFGALSRTDFIIEVHDAAGETTILDEMQRRFAPTHNHALILFKERQLGDFPGELPSPMDERIKREAMDERRIKGRRWLHLESKTKWQP